MCDCIQFTREALLKVPERNTRLKVPLTFPHSDPTKLRADRLAVAVEKVDVKKRTAPMVILAQFCPFCGEKYPDDQEASDDQTGTT